MKFQREKDALDALEAVEAYVKESLTDARLKARSLEAELNELSRAIKILENRASSLQTSKVHWITPISKEESVPKTVPTDSLQAIISILESSAGPMRVTNIAEYAHRKGLISSTKALNGVSSIVSNKISQNSPKVFINTGWGWWDLSTRQKAKSAAPLAVVEPSVAVDGEPQAEKPIVTETPTVH